MEAPPHPRLWACRRETAIAEKLEVLVSLGLTTSRMEDLYDLDFLGRRYEHDAQIVGAIRATFIRRGAAIPGRLPVGSSDSFAADSTRQVQWRGGLRKSGAVQHRALSVRQRLGRCLWLVLVQAGESGAPVQRSDREDDYE